MNSILSFLNALLIVGIAELGDKTQLLVVGLTSKYKLKDVLTGIFIGITLNSVLAVLLGSLVGAAFSAKMLYVKVAAGLLFLFFALWSLWEGEEEEDGRVRVGKMPVLSIAAAFFVAELGDKTQIATASIAATDAQSAVPVFCGAASGLILANLIGIVFGIFLCKNVPGCVFRYISVAIFWVFGLITLFSPLIELLGKGAGLVVFLIAAVLSVIIGAVIYKKKRVC